MSDWPPPTGISRVASGAARAAAVAAVAVVGLAADPAVAPGSGAVVAQEARGGEAPGPASPAMATRAYVEMWTFHVRDPHQGFEPNFLRALGYRGFFGGTFLNSYDERSYGLGLQRSLVSGQAGPLMVGVGYRAGLVSGYDRKFMELAEELPALPFVQLLGQVDCRGLGLEVGYSGLALSATVSVRF